MFEIVDENVHKEGARIKVVGVGGAGGNAIQTMMASKLSGVDFIAANTDLQALEKNKADQKIQLGEKLTRGLGAGANPDVGRQAAIESCEILAQELEDTDMVFITAGMGGGTGTGAASVIADIAHQQGILTVGVVTKPFTFEGRRRLLHAEMGLEALREKVDTLIVIPNDKLLSISDQQTPILNTFREVDEVLLQAVRGISDLINVHGLINLDFADVRTVMFDKGLAIMGVGESEGENRVVAATKKAISSPLVENISMTGARGVIINVTGDRNLSLMEVNEASSLVTNSAHSEAEIIFGAVIDENLKDKVRVTVIATGFPQENKPPSQSILTHTSSDKTHSSPSSSPNEETQDSKEMTAQEKCQENQFKKPLPRDRLIKKAKRYRESHDFPQVEIKEDETPEENQLSIDFDPQKLEDKKKDDLHSSSPFGVKGLIKKSLSLFFD